MYKGMKKISAKNIHKNAIILEELLLKEFLVPMTEKKNLLYAQRSFNLDDEFDIYYNLGSKFIKKLETILDKYDLAEIDSLETNLFSKNDEKSKLLSRTVELYLYTKLR